MRKVLTLPKTRKRNNFETSLPREACLFFGKIILLKTMPKIVEYLKANWQRVAFVAGLTLIVLSLLLIFVFASMRQGTMVVEPVLNTNTVAVLPTARVYTDLYAVSIDNHVDARPVSGVNQAAIVYEVPVEGNITRYLAFFERGARVPLIGPVRSARLYFLDLMTQYGVSFFFHFGGSPEALAKIDSIASLQQINKDGMGAGGNLFWRDDKRDAPHNAYTSSDNVHKAFDARLGASHQTEAWLMAGEPDIALRGDDGAKINLPIDYNPVWVYNKTENIYRRMVKGADEKDRDGATITAKNVIVLRMDVSVIDEVGRLKVGIAGRGQATVYHNGKTEDATWVAGADNSVPVRFYAADGSEIVLTNGNVWVEVVKK